MSIGAWLLLLATLSAAFAAATSLQRVLYVSVRPQVPRYLSLLAGMLSLAALAYLFHIFLSTDLGYEIVHQYSSRDLPTSYKLSGSWAGQAGSMVLWSAMVLGFWMVEEVRWWRKEAAGLAPSEEPEEQRVRKGRKRRGRKTLTAKQAERKAAPPEGWLTFDLIRAVVMMVAFVLLLATIALEPFAERTTLDPEGGRGLNPVLRTPLMAIHPPIVFIAYALLTFVFAAAVAFLARRDPLWVEVARPWGRLAWFTLTLGIGLGAMWAYETLGWGGYWAWDPVETSSLIPWIGLTAFLHALHSHQRRGDYSYMAPMLAGLSLFLVFFATFVTRSGVWVSVHSYAGSASEAATDRLSSALEASSSLRLTWYAMWAVLVVTLGGAAYRFWKAKEDSAILPPIREGEPTWEWLARGPVSMLATVFLLSTSMVLVLFMLLMGANGSVSPGEYHARVGTFAIPLMAFLVLCMAVRFAGRRRAAAMTGAALVLGLIATLVNPGDLDPPVAWFGTVVGAFGAAAVLGQVVAFAKRPRASRTRVLRRAGSVLVHLGLALVFAAYCLSNVPVLSESDGVSPSEDVPVDHGAYSAVIVDREWDRNTGVVERGEDWDTFNGTVRLYSEGSLLSEEEITVISSWKYREYGTLTYSVEGEPRSMDGEVVASTLRDNHIIIRFQSFRDNGMSVVVDLLDPSVDLTVWPALYDDADVLEGEIMRVRAGGEDVTGFLVDVDGEGGNVTLRTPQGDLEVLEGSSVERVFRKAYTGLPMTDVHIHRTLVKDVYVSVLSVGPTDGGGFQVTLMVSEVPGMTVLWTGMALMSLGVVLRPLEDYGERHIGEVDDHVGDDADEGDAGNEDPRKESDEDES